MDSNLISVFGSTGFIGGNFVKMFPDKVTIIPREHRIPKSKNILYFISTVDNYNVFDDITLDVETNLKVLCEVLKYCKDSDIVFNFISSWFVYGETNLPAKEEELCSPMGFYSITKKAAEDLLISFCKTFNVKYRILRLCNVLGNGDGKVSPRKNALTYLISSLKKDEDVFLYDGGTPIRDIMHVYDVCDAINLVCQSGNLNEVYNIGSGHPTRIGDIIDEAKKYLGSRSKINYKDAPEFHKIVQAKDFWMDNSKLLHLGFKQKISTSDIIKELCNTL
jgi:nucleoside-diphosphate-sugar epimerase